MNYLDRFLSVHDHPVSSHFDSTKKDWKCVSPWPWFCLVEYWQGLDNAAVGCGLFIISSQNWRNWSPIVSRSSGAYWFPPKLSPNALFFINCGFDHILEQVGDPQFVFEAKSIQRMELLVLNRLEWRLRVITPCSYIRYFLRKMSKCDQEPSNTLISRSLQVIASKTQGEKYLFFFITLFFVCHFGV